MYSQQAATEFTRYLQPFWHNAGTWRHTADRRTKFLRHLYRATKS